MSETKFEVGKTYPTRGGGSGTVVKILPPAPDDLYRMQVVVTNDDYEDIVDWFTLEGLLYNADKDDLDLLLPAIEPATGPSGPTIRAMRDLQDFWAHFRDSIKCGKIDPTGGGEWPEHNDLAVISCTYPCEAAALSDCDRVIAGVDALLGGRAG